MHRRMKNKEGFNKYLKPGALARLRDSKISARYLAQRLGLVVPASLLAPETGDAGAGRAQIETAEELRFPTLGYGPMCYGRKKLVAAKGSVYNLVNFNGSESVQERSDSFITVGNGDLLVH